MYATGREHLLMAGKSGHRIGVGYREQRERPLYLA